MEWINATLWIVVLILLLHQRKMVQSLKTNLGLQEDKFRWPVDLPASQKEVLEAQKEVLALQREFLNHATRHTAIHPTREPRAGEETSEKHVELQVPKEVQDEKLKFERELEERKKTLEWYEKELRVALDALLELFLYVPANAQKLIISKMPNSVMKKGFKKLSDKVIEYWKQP